MSEDRPGGTIEAEQEWTRATDGALAAVFPSAKVPGRYACCSCAISDFHQALADDQLFTPTGKLTERKVLRYLLLRAQYKRSRLVQESQRQIAETIDTNQPTVARVLRRLVQLGWLRRVDGRSPRSADAYVLTLPEVAKNISTRVPKVPPAGFLVDTNMTAFVHPLFGPQGLGPGPAETFAALPEYVVPLHHGLLIRKTPALPSTPGLVNPWQGRRQIPRARGGKGMTVGDLVRRTGKSRRTVSRHLRRLAGRGMAFEQQGRWWRYRFDPDLLADQLGVPNTASIKADRHHRERLAYDQWAGRLSPVRPSRHLVERLVIDGQVAYVDEATGLLSAEPDSTPYPPNRE